MAPPGSAHSASARGSLMNAAAESERRQVRRIEFNGSPHPLDFARAEALAVEAPLELRLDGDPFMTTMRSPGADRELAAGYLLSEGIVKTRRDLLSLAPCAAARPRSVLEAQLAPGVRLPESRFEARPGLISAACGVCGHADVDALLNQCAPVTSEVALDVAAISRAQHHLEQAQVEFRRTGGTHAAALAERDGTLQRVFEDVGRHNAVDKVLGERLLRDALSLEEHILMLSGRCSFEIIQKAAMAGIPVVVAISAPTDLAVRAAEHLGITLVAFARPQGCNVYTHPERVIPAP